MENFDLISRRQLLRASTVAPVLLTRAPQLFAAEYDLVITGGRVLDVTSAAADELDMKRSGVVPVEIQVLEVGSGKRCQN